MLLLLGAAAIALVFALRWLDASDRISAERALTDGREAGLNALQTFITDQLNSVARRTESFASTTPLQEFVCSPTPESRRDAEVVALELTRSNDVFLSQLRYIDASGMEQIRVNRKFGRIKEATQLQNKSQRPYFTAAIALEAGQFYVSPADFNIEYGKVSVPVEPTMRIATPVVGCNGGPVGIAVANIRLQEWAPAIQTIEENFDVFLAVNSNTHEWQIGGMGLEFSRQPTGDEPGMSFQLAATPPPQPESSRRVSYETLLLGGLNSNKIRAAEALELSAMTPPKIADANAASLDELIFGRYLAALAAFSVFGSLLGFAVVRAASASNTHTGALVLHEQTLDGMSDGIMMVDHHGSIVAANEAAQRMFGYQKNEFRRLRIEDLVGGRGADEHEVLVGMFFKGNQGHTIGSGRLVLGRRKDGHDVPVRVTLSAPFDAEGQRVTVAMVQQIDQRDSAKT